MCHWHLILLQEELKDLDIGVLINNVGVSYDHADYFDQIDDKLIDDLININIQATNKVEHQPLTQTPGHQLVTSSSLANQQVSQAVLCLPSSTARWSVHGDANIQVCKAL